MAKGSLQRRHRQHLSILLARDSAPGSARSAFVRAKKLVTGYRTQLRKIARHIGDITHAFEADPLGSAPRLASMLRRYAETITPWAEATAERMVAEVASHDKQSWRKVSADIGRLVHKEIESAPTGALMRQLQVEQVILIRNLPLDAAERVQRIATEGIAKGTRASELSAEIMRSGEVSRSHSDLISRTEVGRAATNLTQARAQYIGSPGYLWRTARDADCRASHRAMEGKFVAWGEPPTLDKLIGHAGTLPNCRCYCEVSVPNA